MNCIICGRSAFSPAAVKPFSSVPLCRTCSAELSQEYLFNRTFSFCRYCGFPTLTGAVCGACRKTDSISNHEAKQDTIQKASCFLYQGIAMELIQHYKFGGVRRLSHIFGKYFLQLLKDLSVQSNQTAVTVPVPSSRKNLKRRGWDQSVEILRASSSDHILISPVLTANPHPGEQKKLNKQQRSSNASERFSIRSSELQKLHTWKNQKNTVIILFDDIRTTGSTLQSAASILTREGIRPDLVISLATD